MPELSPLPREDLAVPDRTLPVRYAAKLVELVEGKHPLVVGKQPLDEGGRLNLIGGGIEPGETPEAAIVREALEEDGLVLDPAYVHQIGGVEGEVVNCRGERLLARWILCGYGAEIQSCNTEYMLSPERAARLRQYEQYMVSDLALKAIAFTQATRCD